MSKRKRTQERRQLEAAESLVEGLRKMGHLPTEGKVTIMISGRRKRKSKRQSKPGGHR